MAHATPCVSILMPTHNRADVIGFAIRSVLAQEYRSLELLIVGDGCTDGTSDIVRSFDDERIRWFDFEKGPGFGYGNRNRALEEARGELIAFLGHDDLWLGDHLSTLIPVFDDPAVDLVYSRPLWISREGEIAPCSFNLRHPKTLADFMGRKANAVPACCFVHRRGCFEQVGYWNDALERSADWDLWIRILERGEGRNVRYVPMPTTLHFRANWRPHKWGARELRRWEGLFRDRALPGILSREIPSGTSEQEVLWREIECDPRAWSRDVRYAAAEFFDFAVANLLEEAETAQTTIAEMARAGRSAERQYQRVRSEYKKLRAGK